MKMGHVLDVNYWKDQNLGYLQSDSKKEPDAFTLYFIDVP